jgi:lysyl-tRNA synthetase class 2
MTDMPDDIRWRRPLPSGATRRDLLIRRHAIRRAVRAWLDRAGFVEIDAPLLVTGTTPDAAIATFTVDDRALPTSTEYQIKRLVAGGFERLYTLTSNFRRGDLGRLHAPEFTMLEWARVGVTLTAIEDDVTEIVRAAAAAVDGGGAVGARDVCPDAIVYRGRRIDLASPWPRVPVATAIAAAAGVPVDDFAAGPLRAAGAALGLAMPTPADDDARDDDAAHDDAALAFSVVIEHVQRGLGHDRPVLLTDWPAFQTASAPARPDRPGFAQRSELVIAGIEIADGFPSLTDHAAQVAAFAAQQAARRRLGLPDVTLDTRYLAALDRGLPAGAGMALGFDRLVMLLTDATDIRHVQAFAWDEV